jgi:arylsulfatase A-like enzyme
MLAGRDPARYGVIDNLFPILLASDQRAGMPTSEKSIAKYMKELGYNTGFSGKWHLGMTNGTDNAAFTPINHGFDFVKFFIEVSSSAAIMPRSQTSSIFALKSLKIKCIIYYLYCIGVEWRSL